MSIRRLRPSVLSALRVPRSFSLSSLAALSDIFCSAAKSRGARALERVAGQSCVWLAVVLLAVLGGASSAEAQTATFSGAETTIVSGLNQPYGVAVDSSGNVYIADSDNNRVLMETLSGSSYTQSTVASGLNYPFGLAVDSSGNVYIADTDNNRVLKETVSGGSYTQSTVASGLNGPYGVAVNSSGNVYIADTYNNRVLMETVTGGSYTQTTVVSSGVSGLANPTGVAVDGGGNVYIAEISGDRQVLKETLSGGSYTQTTIGSGFNEPSAVAVDGAGNVYVGDSASNRVLKETVSGGSYTQTILSSGSVQPFGVAVDGSGNVYIADAPNNRVVKVAAGGVNFNAVNIGASSASIPLTFTFDTDGSIGAPVVLTGGAPNLDFADAGGGSCDTNGTGYSYNVGDTCTVNVTFTPKFAGARNGGVTLSDATGVIATAYVYGTGVGPQVAFGPGKRSTLGGGFNNPWGVAVDGSGNVYVADNGNQDVKEMTPGCASSSCVTRLGGGFDYPQSVAVDGSGNVYVADTVNNAVKEMPPGCASSSCVTTLGGGFSYPYGLAVDGSGNVYVADQLNNAVKEMPSGCASSSCVTTLGGGFSSPNAVAVDANGNVYVVEDGTSAVKEMPAGCASSSCVTMLGGGFDYPTGVAVDGSGNVYVADTFNNAVKEMPAGCASSSCVTSLGSFNFPQGVAVDASGNVYIGNSLNYTVNELNVTNPSGLSFASTSIGSQSASPQTVTLANIGNAPLSLLTPLTSGINPSVSAGFTLDSATNCPEISSSAAPGTLAAGTSCALAVDFTPTVPGPISGALTLTDNNLNNPSTTQAIPLSGTGVQITLSPSAATLPPGTVGTYYSQTFTAGGGTGPYTYGFTGTLPAGLSLSSAGVLSGTPTTAAPYNFSITATDASTPETFSGSQGYSLTVTAASPAAPTIGTATAGNAQAIVSFTAPASNGGSTIISYTVTSSPGGITATGAGSPITVTGLTNGTAYTFTVTATNSTGTGVASAGSNSVTPQGTQTITFGNPGSLTFGTSPTLTASSNSGLEVTFSSSTLPVCTITSGGALTFAGIGLCTIDANQAGGSAYTAATQVSQSFTVNAETPTLAFTPIASQTFGTAPFPVSATSNSTGAITYAVLSGPASIPVGSNIVTLTGVGMVMLQASVASAGNYGATTAQTGFMVGAETPTLKFGLIANQLYPESSFEVGATSNSTGAITYSVVSGPASIPVGSNIVTLTGTGAVELEASQAALGNYGATMATTSFTVTSASSFTITADPGSETIKAGVLAAFVLDLKSVAGFNGNVALSCSGGPAGSSCADLPMTVKVDGTALAISGILFPAKTAPGTYTMTFTGTSGSLVESTTAQFIVPVETPTLSFAPISGKTYGAAPFAVSATSDSTGAVTYSVVSGPAQISGDLVSLTGPGTVELKATLAATSEYAAATATTSFTVAAEAPTLAFKPIATQTDGAKIDVSATSDSTGAITYSVVSGPAKISGDVVTLTGTGTVELKASQAADGDYAAATATTSFSVAR